MRLGLLLLTSFVVATRFVGIDYLLPHLSEPDQYLVPQTEFLWEGGDPKAAPLSFFWYYSLLPQVLALTPDPALAAAEKDPRSLEQQLEAASEPIARMRRLIAFLSVLIAPATFLLARRFLGAWEALLAAALMSTCFLYFHFSTQARPHAAQATLALLAVLAALHLQSRPTWPSYLLAGVLAALAIGCLQNGIFVLPPLALAHLLRERPGAEDAWRRRILRGSARFGLALVPFVASFLWFGPAFNEEQSDTRITRTPYGRPETKPVDQQRESYTAPLALRDGAIELGPQRLVLEWFDGSGFPHSIRYLWWNDPVLLLFGAGGLALLASRAVRVWRSIPPERRRPRMLGRLDQIFVAPRARALALATAYAVPFVLVLGSYAHTWGRFLLPVLPYLACLAAFGASAALRLASRRLRSPERRAFAVGAGALAILALPGYATFHRARLQKRPDTLERAAAWIAEHVDPRASRILLEPSLTLPLFSRRDALGLDLQYKSGQFSRWLCYQDLFLGPPPPGEEYQIFMVPQSRGVRRMLSTPKGAREFVRASGADYAVLELSQRTTSLRPLENFHQAVAASGALVARFTARAPEASDLLWLDYQDAPGMLWCNLRAWALGPRIEIYRIDRTAGGGPR